MKKAILLLSILTVIITGSCSNSDVNQERSLHHNNAVISDSVVDKVYELDLNDALTLIDSLEDCRELSEPRANYIRGLVYNEAGQERMTELYFKKAVADSHFQKQYPYYFYHAYNNLSIIYYNRFLLADAITYATKGYAIACKDTSLTAQQYQTRFLAQIGSCQMRLGQTKEANANFEKAYQSIWLLAKDPSGYKNLDALATITNNILIDISEQEGQMAEAPVWIERAEKAIAMLDTSSIVTTVTKDRRKARLTASKAIILAQQKQYEAADSAFQQLLKTEFAQTYDGLVDRITYLDEAHRWKEVVELMQKLDSIDQADGTPLTLDYLRSSLALLYKAYSNEDDIVNALKTADRIVAGLDSAYITQQQSDATELAVMYQTQEKEAQIAQQNASMKQQRAIGAAVILGIMLICLIVVMTIRHKASVRLREKNRQLEDKNKELIIANARAEESSRMKTDFIQQISHEIRTPLNILSGFTQIVTTPGMTLQEKELSDARLQILKNTNRITGLVNKMLELSEASSQVVIQRNDCVSAVQIAAQAAEDSGINEVVHIRFDMEITPEAENLTFKTNLPQAARVLSLVLDNAQKFTKQGHVTLHISSAQQDERPVVNFTVEDTGIGIPKEEAEHVFEEFVQLDEYYNGTGIGLTIARSIARRLNGDLTLDTNYEGGARFIMTLPIKD
jgi:signal transduction histidine kinase